MPAQWAVGFPNLRREPVRYEALKVVENYATNRQAIALVVFDAVRGVRLWDAALPPGTAVETKDQIVFGVRLAARKYESAALGYAVRSRVDPVAAAPARQGGAVTHLHRGRALGPRIYRAVLTELEPGKIGSSGKFVHARQRL